MCEVEIYNEIGSGRNGLTYQPTTVYKGRLRNSIEFVAVKCIDIQRLAEVTSSFNLAKKLNHDNIVKVMGLVQDSSRLQLIVEYCPGGTLLDLLERDVSLPESVIQIFASDILSAFKYLHNNKILYRDLSPRNILLDECGLIKLGDFCRSGKFGEPIDFSLVDIEMLQFLPPELLNDESMPTIASDIYGFGCLLYYMATGSPPFVSTDEDMLINMIFNEQVCKIDEMSNEFNDLIKKCLSKDPNNRPTWKELVSHKFLKEALLDRLDDAFVDLKTLPNDSIFITDQRNAQTPNNNQRNSRSFALSQSLSVSLKGSLSNYINMNQKNSQQNDQQNIQQKNDLIKNKKDLLKSSIDIKARETNTQDQKDSKSDSIKECEFGFTNSKTLMYEAIKNLILQNNLFSQNYLSVNPSIMKDNFPPFEGIAMPVSPASLRSNNADDVEKSVSKLCSFFKGPDRMNTKSPVLTYLITQSKFPETAQNIANSPLLNVLIEQAVETSHSQLSALFLTLYGSILSNTSYIGPKNIKSLIEKLPVLEKLCSSPHDSITEKAVAAVGELLSFLCRTDSISDDISSLFSVFSKIVLNALKSKNDTSRHISLKIIINVSLSGYLTEVFENIDIIENVLSHFEITSQSNNQGNNQINYLNESFSICVAAIFIFKPPTLLDFASRVSHQLISLSNNSNAQIMGIVIATATNTLLAMRDLIVNIFNEGNGEVKNKAFLALCLIFKDHSHEFVELAPKFFSHLEKFLNVPDFEPVVSWAIQCCESAVDAVTVGEDYDLLQIVYQAIQIKQLALSIWTTKFEKKVRKIVRNTTFNNAKSEVALQLIQCALCYNICDFSIVSDLCRALNSQLGIVRFTVVKIIADASSQKPFSDSLMQFIESNVLTQLIALLQDEPFVVDQTLRILYNSAEMKPEKDSTVLKAISKPSVVSLIISSVIDNTYALNLITRIIDARTVSVDSLLQARLVPTILSSMEKKPLNNQNYANNANNSNAGNNNVAANNGLSVGTNDGSLRLLRSALNMVAHQMSEMKRDAKRNFMKSVHSLATMGPKTAVMLLDSDLACECFCLLVRIFEPQGTQNEVLIDSSLHPFSISLSQGCRRPECAGNLIQALNTLQWAAENSSAVRLRLKGAGTLMSALKKAAEYGSEELKAASIACQKVIRG
ncbi:CAMK family protein kinase [Tritrichomonas foetus]|uniref:CAMK family protein kinase n=1 Tax=Tritrichomonas foetus TaxID=1144522 RepID=A0A1J4L0C6_9EUKA|nr:CAMK family protein kinase [Tritrichomonas foetus]|eukprot:OHT16915.1 CAMK family protein kinase [Tritrichomonas foetus]